MESATIAVTLLGLAAGVLFRLKVLLLLAGLVLIISMVFSVNSGFTFLHAAITVMVAQMLLQGSYFLGLLIRSISSVFHRARPRL